jgi:hypothetical protein
MDAKKPIAIIIDFYLLTSNVGSLTAYLETYRQALVVRREGDGADRFSMALEGWQ